MSVLVVFIDVIKTVPTLMDRTHVVAELAMHWTVTDEHAMVIHAKNLIIVLPAHNNIICMQISMSAHQGLISAIKSVRTP